MDAVSGNSIDIDFSEVVSELRELNNTLDGLQTDINIGFDGIQSLMEELSASVCSAYDKLVEFIGSHFGILPEYQSVIVGVLLFLVLCFVIWLVYRFFRIFF